MISRRAACGIAWAVVICVGTLADAGEAKEPAPQPVRVAMYSGATEYHSDETLAKLKDSLEHRYNVRCTLNDVTDKHTLPGADQLESCDVMLVFTRRVECPPEQVEQIKRYMESGKGVVGIRTASHAFQTWLAFDHEVLGGDYHNHVKDDKLARLTIPPAAKGHPVLAGVEPFTTMGKLYINPHLAADDTVLLDAKSDDDAEPVAWARTRAGHKDQRVFYTSLGVPADFENEHFRQMIANAIFWTAKREPEKREPEKR